MSCEGCGDAGFVLVAVERGKPGVPVPCKCVPLDLRARWCGIPERYVSAAFENFDPLDGKTDALTVALKWDGTRSMVFAGAVGTGKTHLICAMGISSIRRGNPVKFIEVTRFLDGLKERFGTDQVQPYFDAVANCPTLLIDDLGAEQDTPWTEERLRALLNHRYSRRLPTLVSTNLGHSQLRQSLGEAVASRMSEWQWVAVGGIDVRPTLAVYE